MRQKTVWRRAVHDSGGRYVTTVEVTDDPKIVAFSCVVTGPRGGNSRLTSFGLTEQEWDEAREAIEKEIYNRDEIVLPEDYDHSVEKWSVKQQQATCDHDWQEQPGESPVDVCPKCGATRA